MKQIEIKHRRTENILLCGEYESIKDALEKNRSSDLRGADLRDAYLGSSDLRSSDLRDADLRNADLGCADLGGADLRGANLRGAYLRDAYLRSSDLRSSDLRNADLRDADLRGADLDGTIANMQCPESGAFIAWKKCRNDIIVKLLIPENAKRSSATTRKCRASESVVLEVFGAEIGISQHDCKFRYKKGETVKADEFEENRWVECGGGIHFFITRQEAESY